MKNRPVSATRRTIHRRQFRWLAGIAVAILAVSAAAVPSAGAAPTPATTTTIQYTPNTVQISTTVINAQLMAVSANGVKYTFRSNTGVLTKLQSGKVMLLQHLAVRKVTKTAMANGHLLVYTKPAAITDFILNGTLTWNKAVAFTNGFGVGGTAVPQRPAQEPSAASATGAGSVESMFGMVPLAIGPITYKGTANTWTYTITFTPSSTGVSVAITLGKSSPVEVEAKITGTLNNLTSAGKIAIANSKLTSARMAASQLSGKFTLAYSAKPLTAFGLGTAGGIKITIPGEIAVPFFVGPVPFYIGVKVAFFASAGFSGFDQSLSGSWTLTYSGSSGFSTSSSGANTAVGALTSLGTMVLNAINAVKTGPLSFIFGAQMPQLELGLGVKGLSVAGNVTLVGNTGIQTYGAGCDARLFEILGTAGATAQAFGFSTTLASAKLFDKKIYRAYPSGCGKFNG